MWLRGNNSCSLRILNNWCIKYRKYLSSTTIFTIFIRVRLKFTSRILRSSIKLKNYYCRCIAKNNFIFEQKWQLTGHVNNYRCLCLRCVSFTFDWWISNSKQFFINETKSWVYSFHENSVAAEFRCHLFTIFIVNFIKLSKK